MPLWSLFLLDVAKQSPTCKAVNPNMYNKRPNHNANQCLLDMNGRPLFQGNDPYQLQHVSNLGNSSLASKYDIRQPLWHPALSLNHQLAIRRSRLGVLELLTSPPVRRIDHYPLAPFPAYFSCWSIPHHADIVCWSLPLLASCKEHIIWIPRCWSKSIRSGKWVRAAKISLEQVPRVIFLLTWTVTLMIAQPSLPMVSPWVHLWFGHVDNSAALNL